MAPPSYGQDLESPILITGAPRSGTSMIAGILEEHGVQGGETVGSLSHNPTGLRENAALKSFGTKGILEINGWDRYGQKPIPPVVRTFQMNSGKFSRATVARTLRSQGYQEGPWYFKDCKLTWVWPNWRMVFPGALWVIVRRNKKQIALSCMRQSFMNKYKTMDEWIGYVDRHIEQYEAMDYCPREMAIFEIWADDVMNGDYAKLAWILDLKGISFDSQIAEDFIRPDLWHKPKKEDK